MPRNGWLLRVIIFMVFHATCCKLTGKRDLCRKNRPPAIMGCKFYADPCEKNQDY